MVGDAAHRIPPTGALGLNSGLGDAQNLVWKLALALKSEKDFGALLETYDIERRPIGTTVAKHSLWNAQNNAGSVDYAVGINSEMSTEENVAALRVLRARGTPESEAAWARVQVVMDRLDAEFAEQGIEIGYQCKRAFSSSDTNLILKDLYPDHAGALAFGPGEQQYQDPNALADSHELGLPMNTHEYIPSVAVGVFFPHAWITSSDSGAPLSTIDLVKIGRFLLVTGPIGAEKWKAALFESRSPLRSYVDFASIAPANSTGQYVAKDEAWSDFCPKGGAILVRPDLIIGWIGKADHEKELDTGLSALLKTTI